jgi:hypothetical protein
MSRSSMRTVTLGAAATRRRISLRSAWSGNGLRRGSCGGYRTFIDAMALIEQSPSNLNIVGADRLWWTPHW